MKRMGIIITICFWSTTFIQAQVVTSVPPTIGNDRFLNEIYTSIKRPGLSVVGFDNGGNHSKGYGLKQILNQVYVTGTNEQKKLFQDIIGFSLLNDIEPNPTSEDQYTDNSNILQYRAFEALASYILEENGIDSATSSQTYDITIREHGSVLNSLVNDLVILSNAGNGYLVKPFGDYVDETKIYGNIARAIDLYLALENAYTKWPEHSGNSAMLLSNQEKKVLNLNFLSAIAQLKNEVQKENFLGPDDDEVEPGNRPLKGYMAMGYSSLAAQKDSTELPWHWEYIEYNPTLARIRGSASTSSDRMKKWMYQTDNGKRMWAEGPYYFNYVLLDVIPFWHAIRANDMLYGVSDPFKNNWFLTPVEWLADISTPDGLTPPIDDGNKARISSAPLLRWSSTYSNTELGAKVGKKFNAIYQTAKDYYDNTGDNVYRYGNNTWLLELAIPKATNTFPINYDVYGPDEQQMIIRYSDNAGRLHYVLLNGEFGKGISRGEGHEQPDQLQLLYYVDGTSYLMDTGYDFPDLETGACIWPFCKGLRIIPDWEPSSWNEWRYHNVMNTDYKLNLEPQKGWVSEHGYKKRVISDFRHYSVDNFEYSEVANIIHLNGKFTSVIYNSNSQTIGYLPYIRDVLFIADPVNPYIVDMNKLSGPHPLDNYQPSMRYFGNGLAGTTTNKWHSWKVSDRSNENLDLFMYLKPVEFTQPITYTEGTLDVNEGYRDTVIATVKGLNYKDFGSGLNTRFNTVGLIQVGTSGSTFNAPKMQYDWNSKVQQSSHQIFTVKTNNNTIDVIWRRSFSTSSTLSEEISFDGEFNSKIYLSPNSMYGFARFKKQNGLWRIDNDYKVNIIQPGYFYTSNHTVGNYTYPTGTNIYVGDNVTLTFSGTVNLNEANVFLGKDAKIAVNSSGKIIAEDTEFKRLNSNEEYKGVWISYADNNQFTNCTFTGAFRALQFSNSTLNDVFHSDFKENAYGMYVMNNSEVLIGAGEFRDNDFDGIRAYNNSDITIMDLGTELFESPHFLYNGDDAIDLDNYSNLWVTQAYFLYNDENDITIDNTSRAYVGNGANYQSGPVGGLPLGMNRFTRSEGNYIYNLAMTTDGENLINWIVPAQQNYWNGSAPDPNWFHGPVDHSNWITNYTQSKVNQAPVSSPTEVLTAAKVSQLAAEEKEEYKQQRLVRIQKDLMELRSWMNDKPMDPENGRWLRAYNSLLHFAGQDKFQSDRQLLRGQKNNWLARFHTLSSLTADSLSEMEQQASLQMNGPIKTNREPGRSAIQRNTMFRSSNLVGEVAVLLEIEQALRQQNFNRVVQLYDKYASTIHNIDNQYALLSALSAAYQGRGEYGASLGALEELEALKPDKMMAEGYVAPDLSDIKTMLADSAKSNSQRIQFAKAKPGKIAVQDEQPSEFRLANAYPNPFNPTTTIAFDIPEAGKVRIEVFNISGRLVSVLSNQIHQPGRHQLTFNADGLASGVYLVRAQYAGNTETRKITLVK